MKTEGYIRVFIYAKTPQEIIFINNLTEKAMIDNIQQSINDQFNDHIAETLSNFFGLNKKRKFKIFNN